MDIHSNLFSTELDFNNKNAEDVFYWLQVLRLPASGVPQFHVFYKKDLKWEFWFFSYDVACHLCVSSASVVEVEPIFISKGSWEGCGARAEGRRTSYGQNSRCRVSTIAPWLEWSHFINKEKLQLFGALGFRGLGKCLIVSRATFWLVTYHLSLKCGRRFAVDFNVDFQPGRACCDQCFGGFHLDPPNLPSPEIRPY